MVDKISVHYKDYNTKTTEEGIKRKLNDPNLTAKQKEVIKRYYDYLNKQSLTVRSIDGYLWRLVQIFKFLDNPLNPTEKDIDKYVEYLKKYEPTSQRNFRVFLIIFYTWYLGKTKAEIPFLKDLKAVVEKQTMKLPSDLLTPEDVKKMIAVSNNFRDKCILSLLYETGARCGELLQLKVGDVNSLAEKGKKFGYLNIPKGKTTPRRIPIIFSIPHVLNLINSHAQRDNKEAPLFLNTTTRQNKGLAFDGLKRMLRVTAERAKIGKRVHAHLFRHSRLTELATILTEQELKVYAGWVANSGMAAVYVHLSDEQVGNKLLANAGLMTIKGVDKSKVLMQIECPTCQEVNPSDVKLCQKCGRILDIKEAQKEIEKVKVKDSEIETLKKKMEERLKAQEEKEEKTTTILKDIMNQINVLKGGKPDRYSVKKVVSNAH